MTLDPFYDPAFDQTYQTDSGQLNQDQPYRASRVQSYSIITGESSAMSIQYADEELQRVDDIIKRNDIRFIRLQFSDIIGIAKHVTIPIGHWDNAVSHGMWFDGSSVEGFARIAESDMYLVPDLTTFAVVPWEMDLSTARVICDVYTPDGEPFSGDPRFVLKRQLERARNMGLDYQVGPELEFFLFERYPDGSLTPLKPHDRAGYFDVSTDLAHSVRRQMVDALQAMGIQVEAAHHEVAVGQSEIDFAYGPALITADNTITFRTTLKAIAQKNNLYCTFSRWIDQQVTPFPRYLGVLEEMQLLAQRLLIFGMHVHIGIEDRALAVDTMNVVRYMLPHILALSASSPFWLGRKTGLKSYRSVVFQDFPRSGIPDICRSETDYDNLVRTLVNAGCIPDASKIWWDVRPHHKYPTLEFRICDICTRVDEAMAITALFQALVLWLWKLRRNNITFRIYRRDLIEENRWRASRYGLDGKMIDFGKGQELPTRQLVRELVDLVAEEVDELGTRDYLRPLELMLMHGTSADRQLRIYDANDGDLKAVVDHLLAETATGLDL